MVLELSKAQLKGDTLQISCFSSDELIAGALTRRPDLTAIVRAQFELSLAPTLCGHLDLLEIALANMLENAVKFGQAPFKLTSCELQDAGAQRFFLQISHPIAQSNPVVPDRGHGLGILICQTVAALHQGQFQLQLPTTALSAEKSPVKALL